MEGDTVVVALSNNLQWCDHVDTGMEAKVLGGSSFRHCINPSQAKLLQINSTETTFSHSKSSSKVFWVTWMKKAAYVEGAFYSKQVFTCLV
jgi:hypothetical protein